MDSQGETALSNAVLDEARGISILLVDDNQSNLVALEAILKPLGHRLVMAHSGQEVFRHLLQNDFAVILMDVQMPGIDGFRTAALIKKRERNRHIPIIFLTAMSKDAACVLKGYEQGAVDYILKPFDPEILRSKVSVFVELFLQKEQIKRQAAMLREQEREVLERKGDLRYRNLMDAMPLCIWCMRPNGDVYYCNPVWRELSGIDPGQNINDGYWAAIHSDDRGQLQAALEESIRSGQAFETQYRIRRQSDGVYRWHLGRTVPERDEAGQIIGWIATATDIDDQKTIAGKLQEALTARDEFLSTAGHELRTPLTSLQLTVQGLLRKASKGSSHGLSADQILAKLKTVDQLIRRQAKLVEDLLDVSRITSGKLQLELEQFDLLSVVREVVGRFEDEIRAAGCSLTLRGKGPIVGRWDRTRVDQILTNLLSNARKYGSEKPIEVTVDSDSEHARISISDHGIGIAAKDQSRIFERFARAVPDPNYSGFGLGLWISRQIIEALGGTIRVTSEVGVGSTFTVELPMMGDWHLTLAQNTLR